ncbi:MAG TPA: hypothetical protein VGG05_24975 [Pseudonocardiaceae bacterium]
MNRQVSIRAGIFAGPEAIRIGASIRSADVQQLFVEAADAG